MVNFKVLEVNKFCFCIPLEIGAKIFAFSHLIVCGLILAFVYYLQIRYFSSVRTIHELETIDFMLHLTDVGVTLQIVFGFYLLIGLYERSPVLLLSWMMYEITSIIIGLYIVILEICLGRNHIWRLSLVFLGSASEEILFIVTYSFFCLMIYGVYKKLSRERHEKEGQVKWNSRDPNNIVCGLILAFVYYIQIKYFTSDSVKHDLVTIDSMLLLTDVGVTLQIVFGIYLLIGLYERSSVLLLSWMMYEITSIIIGLYIVILELPTGRNHIRRLSLVSDVTGGVSTALDEILFIVAYSFFCLMIYGIYKKLSRERHEIGGQVKWSSRDPNYVY